MDPPMASAEGHTPQFWMEHVRLGRWMSITVIAMITVYLAATPDRPNRPLLWALVAVASLITVVVALLPWQRLAERGLALRLMVAWSAALIPLLVLLASLDEGIDSPMTLLLVLPLVFSAMAYPVRATAGLGAATLAGHLAIVATSPGEHIGDMIIPPVILAMIGLMGTLIARNHAQSLSRVQDLAHRLDELARVDSLTGCLNHRGFRERLDGEAAVVERARQPLALLHLDLDHFKRINDTFGHPAGDEVLAAVGAELAGVARRSDVVARVGGEEFALLLPDTGVARAREVAERLRRAIRAIDHPAGATASIGVSCLPETARNQDELVATADRALYEAKRAGRNRVVVAPGQPGVALATAGPGRSPGGPGA